MGQAFSQCPECQTPIGECKMRDVFKEQPINRDNLDISHIKKGDYKKKTIHKQVQHSSVSINFGQSLVVEQSPKKVSKKIVKELNNSVVSQIKKPLSLQGVIKTVQLKKGIKYTGGTIENQPHQRGKVVWEDGAVLNGQFFLGQLAQNEKIYIELPDGSVYEGEVVEAKANGKGRLTLPNGTFIEGIWLNDQPHGLAKHKMQNGQFYQGNFVKGIKNGKGKLYFDNDAMYEGLFQNDQFHGEGILILGDGRNIRGIWKNGLLQGKAVMEWKSGQRYVGNFCKGVRQGSGTYYFSDGRQWEGQWQDDLQNGFGSYLVRGEMVKSVWKSGIKKDQIRGIDISRV